jgi:transcription antitermination factor NusG
MEIVGEQTQRGEALPAPWFALWVRSHFEQLVCDQLTARGFHMFLPTMRIWSRRGGRRHVVSIPMFPGYLFVRHEMDKNSHVQILGARGVVKVLGEGWDRLARIDQAEVDAIQQLHGADVPVFPHVYLREGQHVRIVEGPLAGLQGVLVQSKPSKGLLVVSVELLQRSVAVEVDCTLVEPVGAAPQARGSRTSNSRSAALWA